jgi:hypothetical protein
MTTETRKPAYYPRWKLGVFERTVLGTVCGYYVGWKYRYMNRGRNIRAGLYFPTAESARKFRDEIENGRRTLENFDRQIA